MIECAEKEFQFLDQECAVSNEDGLKAEENNYVSFDDVEFNVKEQKVVMKQFSVAEEEKEEEEGEIYANLEVSEEEDSDVNPFAVKDHTSQEVNTTALPPGDKPAEFPTVWLG